MCEETKVCSNEKCKLYGVEQPIENFGFLKRKPYQRLKACKLCADKRNASHADRRKMDSAGTKVCRLKSCKNAGKPQPIDNFSMLKRVKGARYNVCKECTEVGKNNGRIAKLTDKNYGTDRLAGYHNPMSSDNGRMLMFMVSKSLCEGTGAR